DVSPQEVAHEVVSAALASEIGSESRERDSTSADEFKGAEPDPILGAMRQTPDADATARLLVNAEIRNGESGVPKVGASSEELTRDALRRPERESHDGDESRGIGLGMVLLASYASAVTIALVWLIASGRARVGHAMPATIAADSRPDLGADGARALPAAE